MGLLPKEAINEDALKPFVIELKLYVNRRLKEKGAITEELCQRAEELIVKG